ncbi:hypothetical protein P7K49_003787 [Saguinus oedipus]|uniref:BACK domain-containing protein n=1 Tax=Saguinus oedipus TaxID=9490 RepID=A0ABQ9W678_SAGOE|nr:hypothetical protein P7K49_003787 [Saguinus oedipus]
MEVDTIGAVPWSVPASLIICSEGASELGPGRRDRNPQVLLLQTTCTLWEEGHIQDFCLPKLSENLQRQDGKAIGFHVLVSSGSKVGSFQEAAVERADWNTESSGEILFPRKRIFWSTKDKCGKARCGSGERDVGAGLRDPPDNHVVLLSSAVAGPEKLNVLWTTFSCDYDNINRLVWSKWEPYIVQWKMENIVYNSIYEKQHFPEVMLGEEFLSLSLDQVCSLISSDKLTVSSEEKYPYWSGLLFKLYVWTEWKDWIHLVFSGQDLCLHLKCDIAGFPTAPPTLNFLCLCVSGGTEFKFGLIPE